MSFAIWFILLSIISLGVGALADPWLESRLFRLAFFPGILISGICRLAGAGVAGIPVPERRILSGTGRGVRVDTSGAPWGRILLLSVISYCGPLVVVILADLLAGWPLRIQHPLPALAVGSWALYQIPNQIGLFLLDIWALLKWQAWSYPPLLLWAYVFVGVLLSNAPGKREAAPLWVAALSVGGLVSLGLTVRGGSEADEVFEFAWAGLSVAFAFSLLTLIIALFLAAVHRARSGADSDKGR